MDRNITDRYLFTAIQKGNEHAFEILFKSYYRDLVQVANQIVKENSVADELVGEVFFNIWSKRENIKLNTSVLGYLIVATRNHALNYLKQQKKIHVAIEEISESVADTTQDPVQQLINDENWNFWQQTINKLPPQRQKVFRMNKLEGLSYAEIACRLSISEKTVRNQVQTALRYLKDLVVSTTILFLL